MNRINSCMRGRVGILPAILLWALAGPAQAALPISDAPLFLTVAVPPNITLTLDDSGSMRRAFVPENCLVDSSDCSLLDNRYEKSAKRNLIYYNPAVTYTAPKDAAGVALSTSFNAAYRNGFDTAFGTRDLSTGYRPTAYLDLNAAVATEAYMGHYASDFECNLAAAPKCRYKNTAGAWVNTATACVGANNTAKHNSCRGTHGSGSDPAGMPAYYYVFDSGNAGCDGTTTDNDCYDIRFVTSTSGPGGADERQNFANWYSFYRTRNLATVSAASLAFADLGTSPRVAWQALNSCRGGDASLVDADCDGWKNNFAGVSNAIRPFAGAHKNNFYAWLAQLPTSGGTPLPQSLERVGEYYRTSGDGSPYDDDYTTAGSPQTSCRRNYHILMTDGIWTAAGTAANADGTNTALPESYKGIDTYAPRSPYTDLHSNTLADSAFKYWVTDLVGLDNNLTPLLPDLTDSTDAGQFWSPKNDPATWQHMVNYTIGLGLSGYLTSAGLTWTGDMYGGSYPALASGVTAWPQPSTAANDPDNVADLWHAAINSRGRFFSADDPETLSTAFKAVLTSITADTGSAAALSANSTSLKEGTLVYQAKFNSVDWSGTLLALPVSGAGVVGAPVWDASALIPAHAAREIFTHNGAGGTTFNNCANLSAGQQALLAVDGVSCAARLNWLRGDGSNPALRKRPTTVMADIINSDPVYVKDTDFGYASLPDGTPGKATYAAYVTANDGRQAMIYVGTNGGTLEAINANTGVEAFAYIPAGVYDHLSLLTDPAYTHHFYVDGAPTVSDAYLGGAWKTVLVGGLNAGGKTIYALDVTDPASFGAANVMWEFSDANMGYSYSQPQIGILESGDWVAVLGNGYNSSEGGAYLYVVSLATGNLIKSIQAMDTAGVDDNNGLSTPLLYDADGNGLLDTAYAGDLQGNLWKFDLSSAADIAEWKVAYAGSPLYRACRDDNGNGTYCEAGEQQPITSQPKVSPHTLGGHMVVFGTGRYLTAGDVADTGDQAFYGVRDNGSAVENSTQLQQQTVNMEETAFGFDVRSVTTNPVDWATQQGWYLSLPDDPGERVVSAPIIEANRAIFVTTVPSGDKCLPGGYSWLMEVDILTGGAPGGSVFDLSGEDGTPDDKFDASDLVDGKVVAGLKSTIGLSKTPVWLEKSEDIAFKVMTGTSGGFMSIKNNPCPPAGCIPPGGGGGTVERVYWMQIR